MGLGVGTTNYCGYTGDMLQVGADFYKLSHVPTKRKLLAAKNANDTEPTGDPRVDTAHFRVRLDDDSESELNLRVSVKEYSSNSALGSDVAIVRGLMSTLEGDVSKCDPKSVAAFRPGSSVACMVNYGSQVDVRS